MWPLLLSTMWEIVGDVDQASGVDRHEGEHNVDGGWMENRREMKVTRGDEVEEVR
jgi:hypothetical protein